MSVVYVRTAYYSCGHTRLAVRDVATGSRDDLFLTYPCRACEEIKKAEDWKKQCASPDG